MRKEKMRKKEEREVEKRVMEDKEIVEYEKRERKRGMQEGCGRDGGGGGGGKKFVWKRKTFPWCICF